MKSIEQDFDKQIFASNWLGMTWYVRLNNMKYPSLAQIENGLINEAIIQLQEAMSQVKDA